MIVNVRMNQTLYEKAQKITESIAQLPCAGPFRNPVPEEEGELYYKKIKDPVDLSSILGRILLQEYQYVSDWQNDMHHILKNSRTYNGPSSVITSLAETMINKFDKMCIANFPITLGQWIKSFRYLSRKLHNLYEDETMPKSIEAASLISGTIYQQSLAINSITMPITQKNNKKYSRSIASLLEQMSKKVQTPAPAKHIQITLSISKPLESNRLIPSPIVPVFIDCQNPMENGDEEQQFYRSHSNYYGFPNNTTPVSPPQTEIDDDDSDDFWLQTQKFVYHSFPEFEPTLEVNTPSKPEVPPPAKVEKPSETSEVGQIRRKRGRPKKILAEQTDGSEPRQIIPKKQRGALDGKNKKKKRNESTDESSDEFMDPHITNTRKKRAVQIEEVSDHGSQHSSESLESSSESDDSSGSSDSLESPNLQNATKNKMLKKELQKLTDSDYIMFMEAANQLNGQNDQKEMVALIHRFEPDFPFDLDAIYPTVDITKLSTRTMLKLIHFTKKKFKERGKEYPLC